MVSKYVCQSKLLLTQTGIKIFFLCVLRFVRDSIHSIFDKLQDIPYVNPGNFILFLEKSPEYFSLS